jgi:hypothetical protein
VTAAHCPDQVEYRDEAKARLPLQFAGGWGSQFQDVQVHVGGEERQGPVFRAKRRAAAADGAAAARPHPRGRDRLPPRGIERL